jgi:RNA polymerase sigma-70 factor (ECF subfamily)
MSDEELMKKIKYGDKSALNTLICRYHGPIHAYIVRMGLEYHAASDIVQEVFIKLIRNIESYEPDRPFKPWLYTIASNTFKDYFKKAYVQKDVSSCDMPKNAVSADNPEDIFMLQQDRQTVMTALNNLSEIHREVVVLRYYQDLKLNEISLALSIPLGTVKSRLSNALHNFKKLLTEGAIYSDNKIG